MAHLPWNFAIRSEAAVQTDPFEEEFFIGPSDSELDDGHVASLVRESVQNALDARVGAALKRDRHISKREAVVGRTRGYQAGSIKAFSGLL